LGLQSRYVQPHLFGQSKSAPAQVRHCLAHSDASFALSACYSRRLFPDQGHSSSKCSKASNAHDDSASVIHAKALYRQTEIASDIVNGGRPTFQKEKERKTVQGWRNAFRGGRPVKRECYGLAPYAVSLIRAPCIWAGGIAVYLVIGSSKLDLGHLWFLR